MKTPPFPERLNIHEPAFRLICKTLEADLDEPVCLELAAHLQTCPDCKIYFDSVRKTIKLYRQQFHHERVPADTRMRLYKVLKLDKFNGEETDANQTF